MPMPWRYESACANCWTCGEKVGGNMSGGAHSMRWYHAGALSFGEGALADQAVKHLTCGRPLAIDCDQASIAATYHP